MNNEDNEIDQLFRNGLRVFPVTFKEADWERMKNRMRRRRRFYRYLVWTAVVSSASAALLLLVYNLFEPAGIQPATVRNEIAAKENKDDVESAPDKKEIEKATVHLRVPKVHSPSAQWATGETGRVKKQLHYVSVTPLPKALPSGNGDMTTRFVTSPVLPADSPLGATTYRQRRPVLSMAVLAAPDLTGTRLAGQDRLSMNAGVMANVSITDRLSVTTGIMYAKKYYHTDFSTYNPQSSSAFKYTQPRTVDADCDVLDMPVNINYALYRRGRNTLLLSGGLSSYFMLKERYRFVYDANPEASPYYYPQEQKVYHQEVHHQNNHIMGIANVSLILKRQIGGRTAVSVQPFLKVPLSPVGYGRVPLFSGGIAISAEMDLLRRHK